jgi:hypothetical protein
MIKAADYVNYFNCKNVQVKFLYQCNLYVISEICGYIKKQYFLHYYSL